MVREAPVLVRVLGPLDVVDRGRARPLGSARQREVLAALVVHAGRVVPADALVDVLWGDAPPASAAHTLHGLVWRLRGVVGSAGIVARAPGYLLSLDAVEIDSERFERLVEHARRAAAAGEATESLRGFDAALAGWRGAAYGELADRPFVRPEAVRLEELRAAVVEDRVEILLGSCPPSELVGELEAAVRAEPYRERRQGQLMTVLARSGRSVEAMRSYEGFRRSLADEIGMVPSRALQRLNDDIVRQSPDAEWRGSSAPPWTRAVASDRLPRPQTSFVGRAAELADLVHAMQARELVTVCGPAGVGKTRLAVEAVRAFDGAQPPLGGARWCDLSAVAADRDRPAVEAVAGAVVEALQISPEPGVALRGRVLTFLAGQDLTLVLDNCEHVADAVADLAAEIRRRAPRVGVLATSREPLAIAGERVLDLGPLDGADATQLFLDRGAAARIGFAHAGDDAGLVAEICRRLDGIPLAIELAAGRLRSLGVHDLARLLDDRFRVLVSDRRDAPDRHRTLRTAIDSSYDALSDVERLAFDRLAVFPASFGLDAAEAVCADEAIEATRMIGPEDVLDLLARLVARSLVVIDHDVRGAVRYRLLETLRAYAQERLAARGRDAEPRARRRHAEHFAAQVALVAPLLTGRDEARGVAWLAGELPNLRVAVTWSSERGDLDLATSLFTPMHPWTWCGTVRTAEIGGWAELVVHQPGIEDHPAYPALCEWGCRRMSAAGEPSDVREWTERVTAPGFAPTPLTLRYLANATMPDDPETAIAMLARGADMASAAGDHFTEAILRLAIVSAHTIRFSQPPTEVIDQTLRAVAAARASGSPTATAWALFGVGMLLRDADPAAALAAIDELPEVVDRIESPDITLQHADDYARACMRLAAGDLTGLRSVRALIVGNSSLGHRAQLAIQLLRLAQALVHLGLALERAAEFLAGARASGLSYTPVAEESIRVLRARLGDGPYEAAARGGAGLTLEQLAERALVTIDELLPAAS